MPSCDALHRAQAVLASVTSVALLARPVVAQPSCERLAALALPHTTITSARTRPAGSVPPEFPGMPAVAVPARCEVYALARPTSDSRITIAVWLPVAGWNGRYQQVGNGDGRLGARGGTPSRDVTRRGCYRGQGAPVTRRERERHAAAG
jgi:feruloyl esterase